MQLQNVPRLQREAQQRQEPISMNSEEKTGPLELSTEKMTTVYFVFILCACYLGWFTFLILGLDKLFKRVKLFNDGKNSKIKSRRTLDNKII